MSLGSRYDGSVTPFLPSAEERRQRRRGTIQSAVLRIIYGKQTNAPQQAHNLNRSTMPDMQAEPSPPPYSVGLGEFTLPVISDFEEQPARTPVCDDKLGGIDCRVLNAS